MKAVLLLLPGMLNDAGIWRDVVWPLADALELRAMPTLMQESVPAMARAAWAAVADVPANVSLLLAGFSMGGYVALEMLAQSARPLAGAALVSTSARPESPEGAASREKTIAGMQADFGKVVDGILKWGMHASDPELVQRLRTMMLGVGPGTAIRQNRPAEMERGGTISQAAGRRQPGGNPCTRSPARHVGAAAPGLTSAACAGPAARRARRPARCPACTRWR